MSDTQYTNPLPAPFLIPAAWKGNELFQSADWLINLDERHLLRVWLSVPNSRPLDPLFADNSGNTAAGSLRGGMSPAL